MVTLHYFSSYFVLLVLQSSVFLYAQEPPAPPAIPLPEPPKNASDKIDNVIQPISNPTSGSNSTDQQTVQTNTANNVNVKTNTSNVKEFPKPSEDGPPVVYLNKTCETPQINGLNASKAVPNNQTQCNVTLTGVPENSMKIDTEVSGFLNINETIDNNEVAQQANDATKSISIDGNLTINNEVESVDDGKITEDVLRFPSQQQANAPGVPLVQGQLAAILAAVFVVISVVAYIALLSWRRYLENRYGDRQMLVNENELSDRDDMRHFSI